MIKEEEEEVPIHLRPYDSSKYEVPSAKIKYNTGYAFLDVDPFPRASIMKLSYMILDKLERQIPAEAMYRIYTEE
jgi:NADH dehydrogenase (ubiquinone) 1 alpha subcomplex subunit 5